MMSLREVCTHLANRQASGTLTFSQGEISKQVTLVKGQVVNARSNLPREYLGQFLINIGLISEDQFDRAYETQRETQVYIGRILVMIGLVTEEQVIEALSLKFRETLLSAFPWEDGEFAFTPAETSEAPAELDGVELKVPLEEILGEGEFRESAWQAIRAVFPSGEVRLTLHPEKLPESIKPDSVDARICWMVQDGLTVDEMALALHATDFFLYQRLYALYRLDAVTVRDEDEPLGEPDSVIPEDADEAPNVPAAPKPVLVGLEPTADEMAQTARHLLAEGNAVDAAAMAARAVELSPTPELRALKREAELALLGKLRGDLLLADAVPQLSIAPEAVKQLALTAPQRYLLSRVDGKRTLRAIVQSSPIPELDALRTFQDFLQGELLSLSPLAA
jgi:hypothetical protein